MTVFSRILVAPVAFKGVLSSPETADAIQSGIISALPKTEVITLPMADGGMDTVQILSDVLNGTVRELEVMGPLGSKVCAKYSIIDEGHTAIIEMSAVAGWVLVPREKRNPFHATTAGVGQLILDAISNGCQKIIVGLGDSATIDVGVGMATELGVVFTDDHGNQIHPIPENFHMISRTDVSKINPKLKDIEFIALADVISPVLGPDGAVVIFGPQKGVTTETMPRMLAAIESMVEVMEAGLGLRLHDEPMTGAAGGLGAGIRAFLNGSLVRGAPFISKLVGLEVAIQNSDLVITGEGKMDRQSFSGKAISEVATLAANNNKPCWAVVGKIADEEAAHHGGIEKLIEISPKKIPPSPKSAKELIKREVEKIFMT